MKIAIVGSGAIGCYYGGRLLQHGFDVHFLMRADYEAVKARGLTIYTATETIFLEHVPVYPSTTEIGPVDLVIVSLKSTSNDALKNLIPPLLHENTMLLTLQNGLGNEECLAENFGAKRVLGGVCFIGVNRTGPGEIKHMGEGMIMMGEFGRDPSPRAQEIAEIFMDSGIPCKVSPSLAEVRWRKLVWNIPFNGLSIALGGITTDLILAGEENTLLVRRLMGEVITAAGALGFLIEPAYIDAQVHRTPALGAYRPSSLIDWQAGAPVEVEAIWGGPLRRGLAAGVKMPELEKLYTTLKETCCKHTP